MGYRRFQAFAPVHTDLLPLVKVCVTRGWRFVTSGHALKGVKTMGSILAISSSRASSFLLITKAFASFIKMYLLLLFLRVLLAWFPTFNWDTQPWIALRQVTDPYLNVFRGLVPPLMGQIDLTPLIGFYLLQMLSSILMAPFSDDPDIW